HRDRCRLAAALVEGVGDVPVPRRVHVHVADGDATAVAVVVHALRVGAAGECRNAGETKDRREGAESRGGLHRFPPLVTVPGGNAPADNAATTSRQALRSRMLAAWTVFATGAP